MSDLRDLSDDDKALKVVTGVLIKACGGPDACAVVIGGGVKPSQVSGYASLNEPRRFMPLRSIALLEAACEQPIVTRFLAVRQGMQLVPSARNDCEGPATIGDEAIVDVAVVGANLKLAIAKARADGRFDAADREILRRAAADYVALGTEIQRAVEQP